MEKELGPEYGSAADSGFKAKYRAACFCNAVRIEVSADPVDSKICHCKACQSLHGAPMQWAVIFHKKDVRITRGIECLKFYNNGQSVNKPETHRQILTQSSIPNRLDLSLAISKVPDARRQGATSEVYIPYSAGRSDRRQRGRWHLDGGSGERILPCKVSCRLCGAPIADEGRRMWLAFPSLFDFGFPPKVPEVFRPTCHIFYGARVMEINDALPKWAGHKDKSERIG